MRKQIALLLAMVLTLTMGLGGAAAVVASPGIVGLWHLDGDALDSSGLGNNGTVLAGATFVPSMPGFGQALARSIENYSMRVPDSPSLDITTELRVGAYVKFDSFAFRSRVVGKVNPPPSTQDSFMLQVGQDGRVGFSIWKSPTETTFLMGGTVLALGPWYHISGSYKYAGDGTSIMKVFVDGRLDGMLTSARGPIFSGSAPLMVGRLAGAVDEVRLWNTSNPMWTLIASPARDVNPVDTDHTVTATVSPASPGVMVRFDVTNGPNTGKSASVRTNGVGQASWTYNDDSVGGGIDTIRVWIDRDMDRSFNLPEDVAVGLLKTWVENFITGGGKMNAPGGKRAGWSFAGTVGVLPGGGADGQFQVVDHANNVAYHMDTFGQLVFSGGTAESPPATHNTAMFIGRAQGNDGTTVRLRVTIRDLGEPGARVDRIKIEQLPATPPPTPMPWPPPPPELPIATWVDGTIDGGNFQVHDTG